MAPRNTEKDGSGKKKQRAKVANRDAQGHGKEHWQAIEEKEELSCQALCDALWQAIEEKEELSCQALWVEREGNTLRLDA